jgi:beta-glucanase (GH16 family)
LQKRARTGTILAAGLGIAGLLATLVIAASVSASGSAGHWTQVWSDSFNGPANAGVNTKSWKYDTGQGIFGNGEIETMTSSPYNVHLDGHGNLDITALGNAGAWTSGRIQTISSQFGAPAGGEMEVSALIMQPAVSPGLGYWPAFWLLGPGTWPGTGEIDVLEDVNALSEHSGALHCGNLTARNPNGTTGPCDEFTGLSSGLMPCAGCQAGYHDYSVIVDRRNAAAQQITWYLDGHRFFSLSERQVGTAAWTAAVDHGYSIIFDLAIGGTYPNGRCGCTTPTAQTKSGGTMSVESVTVRDWTLDSASSNRHQAGHGSR